MVFSTIRFFTSLVNRFDCLGQSLRGTRRSPCRCRFIVIVIVVAVGLTVVIGAVFRARWICEPSILINDCKITKIKSTIHGGGSTSVNGCTSASSFTVFNVFGLGCSSSGSGLEIVSDNGSDDDEDGPVIIGDTAVPVELYKEI